VSWHPWTGVVVQGRGRWRGPSTDPLRDAIEGLASERCAFAELNCVCHLNM